MKVNKSSLIAVGLATGLSVGLLSGCEQLSSFNNDPIVNPSPTLSPASGISKQDILSAQNKLQTVQGKLDELKSFTDGIKVETDNTIKIPVNYTEAQQKIESVVDTYESFKALPQTVKLKIADFDKIDKSIENLLGKDSPARLILSSLASKNSSEAQTKLSEFKIKNESIYPTKIDGEDGSGQRLATKKLLENIVNTVNPNISNFKNSLSQLSSQGTKEIANSGKNNDEIRKVIEDGFMHNQFWFLLNILTLLSVSVSFFLLWNRMSGIVLTHKIKQSKKHPIQDLKQEIINTKNEINSINEKLLWIEIINFLRRGELPQEILDLKNNLDVVAKGIEKIYGKEVIAYSGIVETNTLAEEVEPKPQIDEDDQQDYWIQAFDEIKSNLLEIKSVNLDNNVKSLQDGIDSIKNKLNISEMNQLKIQDLQSQVESLINERSQLEDRVEDQRKKLQLVQGLESNGDVDQLRQEKKTLQDDLDTAIQQSKELELQVKDLENQLQDMTNKRDEFQDLLETQGQELNEVHELRQNKDDLLREKTRLESELSQLNDKFAVANQNIEDFKTTNDQLKSENDRLKKHIKRESPDEASIPLQWQNLIDAYQQKPENIFDCVGIVRGQEVNEDDEKYAERRSNVNRPVILSQNNSPNGYYIVILGTDYLLFPKQHAIPESQKNKAAALFDGYKSGNRSLFTLISPAQVTSLGNGMWQLKHKGRLEYS